MSRSALVETLTAAATAMLGTALAAGCSSSQAEAVPTSSDPTRVEIALRPASRSWRPGGLHPHHRKRCGNLPRTSSSTTGPSCTSASKAFVFLTVDGSRITSSAGQPRGQRGLLRRHRSGDHQLRRALVQLPVDTCEYLAGRSSSGEVTRSLGRAARWLGDGYPLEPEIVAAGTRGRAEPLDSSFARFTLELLALAAPADLVLASQQAGHDEVEHAVACFRVHLASRGRSARRRSTYRASRAARELGAVTAATVRGLRGGRSRHSSPGASLRRRGSAARVLAKIAHDEAQHAQLGWRFTPRALGEAATRPADHHSRGSRRRSMRRWRSTDCAVSRRAPCAPTACSTKKPPRPSPPISSA